MCAVATDTRLETDRLILRAPRRADAPWIADRINDIGIARMATRIPHPYAAADAEAFLQGLDPLEDKVFLVEHREFGPIGMLGFHRQPTEWSETRSSISPELGYWLGRTFWGRGFATEAVSAALDWAGRAWGRRVVTAGYFADNPASGRVLEKAGFLLTGEVQHRFSVARRETAPTRMMVRLA